MTGWWEWKGEHTVMPIMSSFEAEKQHIVKITMVSFILNFRGFCFVLFCYFSGMYLQHFEVPRLGVEMELELMAYATATWDLSRVCNLHHSSWKHWIPDP